MAAKYDLPTKETLDLLAEVRATYHPTLDDHDVRIGLLMAHASVDKNDKPRGPAIRGYAGAAAGAEIRVVPMRDRITKRFDVEIVLDGDMWPEIPLATKRALLDHELTHIDCEGDTDQQGRPKLKIRKEDFIVWGFYEVARRHGMAAIETRSVKKLIDDHGQLLLHGIVEAQPDLPAQDEMSDEDDGKTE